MKRILAVSRKFSLVKPKFQKIRFYNTEVQTKEQETRSFFWNISAKPFPEEITKILLSPIGKTYN